MATAQCPFDATTFSDPDLTQGDVDAALDAHLQRFHDMTLFELREIEKTVPRSDPYFNH